MTWSNARVHSTITKSSLPMYRSLTQAKNGIADSPVIPCCFAMLYQSTQMIPAMFPRMVVDVDGRICAHWLQDCLCL